jgi:hypothetical protein
VVQVREPQELAPVKEVARRNEAEAFQLGRHLQLKKCGSLVVYVQSRRPLVEENEATKYAALIRKDCLGFHSSTSNANDTLAAFR